MTDEAFHLTISLQALESGLSLNVQRVSHFVAAALDAPTTSLTAALQIQGPVLAFQYTPALAWSEADAAREYASWVLLNAFRELAEVTTLFLCSVQSVSITARLQEIQALQGNLSALQWQQLVVDAERRFEKANLPDKLRSLVEDYGLDMPADIVTQIGSLYRVRNCLVHRGGLVQEPDVDESGALTAAWLAMNPYVRSENGEIPLELPHYVDGPAELVLRHELAFKRFVLGARILFSAEEFHEIAYGFVLLAKRIGYVLGIRLRNAGIPSALPTQDKS